MQRAVPSIEIEGLKDSYRSGRPIIYCKKIGGKSLAKLEETPLIDWQDEVAQL